MDKAWATFKWEADRQDVSRDNFKKLLSRIRCAEGAKSSSAAHTTTATGDTDEEQGGWRKWL